MTPETKKVMYWGLGILAGAGLVWGVIALIKKAKSINGTTPKPTGGLVPGKPLYSKINRKLLQYVPNGAEKCYSQSVSAGDFLGTYIKDVSMAEVNNAVPDGPGTCNYLNRPGIIWSGVPDSDQSGNAVQVSRPGGQTLFLGKSSDLYTK